MAVTDLQKIHLVQPDLRRVTPTGHWASDMWIIPHNGLKIEFRAMYKALRGLLAKGDKVSSWDIGQFLEWFKFLNNYLQESHTVTEDTILKWMAAKNVFPEKGSDEHNGLLVSCNYILQNSITKLATEDPVKLTAQLVAEVSNFVNKLLNHFRYEETSVAAIARAHAWAVDKVVEKAYWTKLGQTPNGKLILAISLQWMDKKAIKKFSKDQLGFFGSLKMTGAMEAMLVEHRKILTALFDPDHLIDSSSESEVELEV